MHAEALTLPDVLRLHHICCAEFVVTLCRKAGTDPETDPRYQHHMRIADTGRGQPRHPRPIAQKAPDFHRGPFIIQVSPDLFVAALGGVHVHRVEHVTTNNIVA